MEASNNSIDIKPDDIPVVGYDELVQPSQLGIGYLGANSYISSTGDAKFQSVQIGGKTYQYLITDNGIFSFGDGSDGDVTISSNTTLTGDMNYENLTVDAGFTLNPGGYRIFVKGTLILNGTIARNGNNGGTGAGGAALADGYLKGSLAGGAGGAGGADGAGGTAGSAGGNASNSLGFNGSAGGAGGDRNGGTLFGGAAGAGGTATPANVALRVGIQLAQLLDVSSTGATVKYNNSAAGGGGGGGAGAGGGTGFSGGTGGGGGSNGGIIAIYGREIIINSTGSITANGGNGGNGGDGGSVNAGQGGGGSGGNGGIIILVYNSLTNLGTLSVAAGAAGVKGVVGSGINATDGTAGSAGDTYQFELSL